MKNWTANYLSIRLIATFRDKTRHYYLSARLLSEEFKINNEIEFAIDTGSPLSLLSYKDAQKCKIDFSKLKLVSHVKLIYGDFHRYFLYDYQLIAS